MNLINFEFDPSQTFMPSEATRKWGLYTHKSPHVYAGIVLPGFFQTTYFTFHLIGFIAIFILEGLAILWSFEEGSSIAIILGLAFFDIFLAVMSHRKHNEIVLCKNRILFEKDQVNKTNHQRNLIKYNRYKNFFYFLIMGSAFAKFYFFFSIYFFFNAVSLLIMFLYLLGGLLHISCTGYAVFTIIFYWMISRERNKYLDSQGATLSYGINKEPFVHPIESAQKLILTPVEVDAHKIIEKDGNYYFETNGILNDSQLARMISRQKDENAKREVAINGIAHQYSILTA